MSKFHKMLHRTVRPFEKRFKEHLRIYTQRYEIHPNLQRMEFWTQTRNAMELWKKTIDISYHIIKVCKLNILEELKIHKQYIQLVFLIWLGCFLKMEVRTNLKHILKNKGNVTRKNMLDLSNFFFVSVSLSWKQ